MDDGKKPEDLDQPTPDEMMEDFSDDPGVMDPDEENFEDSFSGDDDFAEDEMTAGGFDDQESSDFSNEEWDTYDEDFAGDDSFGETPVAPKKKVSNKIIIGAALVVGIAVAGYQVVSKSGQETVVAPSTQSPPQPVPSENASNQRDIMPSATKDVPEEDVPEAFGVRNLYKQDFEDTTNQDAKGDQPAGMLNNPDELAAIEDAELDENQYEYEYVYEDELTDSDMGEGTAQPTAAADSQSAPLTPIPSNVTADAESVNVVEVEETEGDMPRMPVPAADTDKQSPSKSPFDSDEPDWEDSNSRDSMAGDMTDENMTQQAAAASEEMSSENQSSGTLNKAEMSILSTQIDRLISRLETLESDMDNMNDLKTSVDRLESRINKLEKSGTAAPQKSSTASTSRQTSSESQKSSYTAPKPSRVTWILKSAQPGQAMVAKEGSSDVISIATGQSLAGIGTVKSIAMKNGRWVVTGTNGTIKQ